MSNSIDCFSKLIALRGSCNDLVPTSGLYINDVGISLNELNEFVSEDFEDGESLFNTQYNLATSIVTNSIHSFFQDRYKAFSLLENKRVGFYSATETWYSGENNKQSGILFELQNTRSYLTFYLSSISLFTNFGGTLPIFVYNLTTGELIDTIAFPSVGNQLTTYTCNKEYNFDSNKVSLFICYDTTGIEFKDCQLTQSAGCASCNSKPRYGNQFITSYNGEIDNSLEKFRHNFESNNSTSGISVVHSLNCNHKSWLCSISNLIALPILYKTASLIVEYGMYITPNEMLTNRSTMNRDLLKERQSLYEQKYNEAMNNVLSNIELPDDERCFRCRQKSRTTIMLP